MFVYGTEVTVHGEDRGLVKMRVGELTFMAETWGGTDGAGFGKHFQIGGIEFVLGKQIGEAGPHLTRWLATPVAEMQAQDEVGPFDDIFGE